MMIVGISNGRSYYFEIEPSFARMSLLTNLGEASNRFGVFFCGKEVFIMLRNGVKNPESNFIILLLSYCLWAT